VISPTTSSGKHDHPVLLSRHPRQGAARIALPLAQVGARAERQRAVRLPPQRFGQVSARGGVVGAQQRSSRPTPHPQLPQLSA
jgi:hypothetical protein